MNTARIALTNGRTAQAIDCLVYIEGHTQSIGGVHSVVRAEGKRFIATRGNGHSSQCDTATHAVETVAAYYLGGGSCDCLICAPDTAQRAQIAEHGPCADNGAHVNLWTDSGGSELCYLCALADDGSFGPLTIACGDVEDSSECAVCNQPLNIAYQFPGLPLNDDRRAWMERSHNLTSSQIDTVLDVLSRVQ